MWSVYNLFEQFGPRSGLKTPCSPNCLTLNGILVKKLGEKVQVEQNQQMTKNYEKFPSVQKVKKVPHYMYFTLLSYFSFEKRLV